MTVGDQHVCDDPVYDPLTIRDSFFRILSLDGFVQIALNQPRCTLTLTLVKTRELVSLLPQLRCDNVHQASNRTARPRWPPRA